jgi:hypothetical protein
MGEWRYSSTINLGTRFSQVVSYMPQPLYPWRNNPSTHWIWGKVGPKGSVDMVVKGRSPVPFIRNWIPASSPYLVTHGAMPSPQNTSHKADPHHWADTELCLCTMLLTSVISYGTHTCATGTAREPMKRIKDNKEMWVWQGNKQEISDYTDEKSWGERESRHNFTVHLHSTLWERQKHIRNGGIFPCIPNLGTWCKHPVSFTLKTFTSELYCTGI